MNLIEAIHKYHSMGWNLIPLKSNGKDPALNEVEPYYETQYPVSALLEQAVKNPDINIGVITGKTSGISVIDIDDASKKDAYLVQYPTQMIASTKRGRHYYYHYDPNLPEIKAIDGGDFFNGHHYVVLPPSKVEGVQREWLNFGEMGKSPIGLFYEQKIDVHSGKYTRQEIQNLVNNAIVKGKFEDGYWNDTILYGSIILIGDGWTKDSVYKLFAPINAKAESPIPAKTVVSMIERASEYASTKVFKGQQNDEVFVNQAHTLDFTSFGDVRSKYADYEANWLVDGWMLDSSIMIVAAPPQRYKTWLSIDLAISVASGLPFLDNYTVNRTGKVLVIQQEDYGARLFARFNAIEKSKLARAELEITLEDDGFISNYNIADQIYFHESSEFTLDDDKLIDDLEKRIVETNAVLCIIDPFYSLSAETKDYYATIASKIRAKIKKIRNKTGCAFLFIHHTRKNGGADTADTFDRNQIYGSQFVSAVMEGAWMVGRKKGTPLTQIYIVRTFKDEDNPPPTSVNFLIHLHDKDDALVYVVEVTDVDDSLLESAKVFLRDNGAATLGELFEAIGDKFSSKTAFLRWLGKQDEITQEGKRGKYSVAPDE